VTLADGQDERLEYGSEVVPVGVALNQPMKVLKVCYVSTHKACRFASRVKTFVVKVALRKMSVSPSERQQGRSSQSQILAQHKVLVRTDSCWRPRLDRGSRRRGRERRYSAFQMKRRHVATGGDAPQASGRVGLSTRTASAGVQPKHRCPSKSPRCGRESMARERPIRIGAMGLVRNCLRLGARTRPTPLWSLRSRRSPGSGSTGRASFGASVGQ
jgi:hypothetical protein